MTATAGGSQEWDVLVLSPHLDDAVFSLGATLARWSSRGQQVLVATLFAGDAPEELSDFARELHELWGFDRASDVGPERRREDVAALDVVGAVAHHEDLLDALYRRAPGGGFAYPDLAALRQSGRQDPVQSEVIVRLEALPRARRVLAPLGIGGHVDHRLVHRAARRVYGAELAFYEDYPYAQSLRARLKVLAQLRFSKRVIEVDEATLERKIRAAGLYASQLIGELADGGIARRLEDFAARRGGEILWQSPRRR